MKRTLFLTLSAAAVTFGTLAQSKFDMQAAYLVNNAQAALMSRSVSGPVLIPEEVTNEFTTIVIFKDEASAAEIQGSAYKVINVRANMALMTLTPAQMNELAAKDDVVSISLGEEVYPKLNIAREVAGVDAIQAGTDGLAQAYTGNGVVVGLMDTGLDLNHINFLDKDENLRAKRLWVITGSSSAVTEYDTPEKIKNFTTDASAGTHGTHVLGIMAGSYNDKGGQTAIINANDKVQVTTLRANPYYGVATDAEIAACAGTLDNNNIIVALEKISGYAKSVGKPAVMNLSLGNNVGPHDGTDARSKYMAEVGKEMIICVSAGNEGSMPVSLHKDFTASDNTIRTFAHTNAAASGRIEMWGSDATKFDVTFVAVNKTNGNIAYSYKLDRNLQGEQVLLCGSYWANQGAIKDAEFNNAFGEKAALYLSSNIDPNNNRYSFNATLSLSVGSSGSNILPGFIVEGQAGKSVDIFAGSGSGLYSNDVSGYTQGNDECSINGMACADNLLVVGAYVNRTSWPVLEKDIFGYRNTTDGDIASFSSYGKTFQGRQLPDICGPGLGMISSYSYYYVEAGNDTDGGKYFSATKEHGKRTSYWKEMSGTSMSSPFVAGVMALWLEADPTLTISDVKEILKETAKQDEFTAQNTQRWGMGKIDALAGIKKVLGLGGVSDITVEADKMLVSPIDDRTYEVFAAGADNVSLQLYSMSGALTASVDATGDTATLSASAAAPGVYILKATANGRTETHKLVLK